MKTEEKANEVSRSVDMCSETEVTNAFCADKNGFNAFWYLKEGRMLNADIIPIPETTKPINTKIEFLIRVV